MASRSTETQSHTISTLVDGGLWRWQLSVQEWTCSCNPDKCDFESWTDFRLTASCEAPFRKTFCFSKAEELCSRNQTSPLGSRYTNCGINKMPLLHTNYDAFPFSLCLAPHQLIIHKPSDVKMWVLLQDWYWCKE